ncbi:MAG: long-chain fatty acid--CoA ligase [Desulfovibrio sp.]|jgi:long-chain acyl-CoA synthetase|nr:long-chain fatty acid--CoA ligase [Desulfovibrio sp.]
MIEGNSRPWFAWYGEHVPRNLNVEARPITEMLDAAAQNWPRRAAVIFQNTRLTYRSLLERAETFAGALKRVGVARGDRVVIMLPNLPQSVIAFWGAVKAGAVVVMMNPLYMEKEILNNIRDCDARHIILLDMLWPRLAALREHLPLKNFIVTGAEDALSFPLNWLYRFNRARNKKTSAIPYDDKHVFAWKTFCKGAARHSEPLAYPEHTPAVIQYTGGTTGVPKGVVLTHANLYTNARQILSIIDETAQTHHTFLSIMPFFHVYGLTICLMIPVELAATVLPVPRYAPQDVLRMIVKHRPSIFPGAPAVYTSLLQQKNLEKYDLKSVKICVSGSAPLPRDIFRRFQETTGAEILEGYGLTEASPITHINPRETLSQRAGSIGIPVPGTDARIVDMDGGALPLPPGKIGELVVKGPQVMSGYWQREDETASALRNGWLYTGDLAVMDEDGFFYIVDRKKDMVIVGGYNVYPREVDEALLEHPDVREAVSVGIKDKLRGEVLKAYIVVKPGKKLAKADIVAWCKKKLAPYKVPRLVEFRDDLPRTIVGKVLRRALRSEEESRAGRKKTGAGENPGNPRGED